jgi:hypothetical protein
LRSEQLRSRDTYNEELEIFSPDVAGRAVAGQCGGRAAKPNAASFVAVTTNRETSP